MVVGTRAIEVAGLTTWAGTECAAAPAGEPLTPPAPPILVLALANGQRVRLIVDAGILEVLPDGWELTLRFEPRPLPPYDQVATAQTRSRRATHSICAS